MGDPTAALVKEIELANQLRDASKALSANATQSQQDAEVRRLTLLCQALIGEAFAAPEEATGIFALAGLSIGMAAAAQEEQNCKNASQSLVAEFDSEFNSAEASLATDELAYQLNNSQTSDFSSLNENSDTGNTNGAISVANQLLGDSQLVGVTDNSSGITYQQSGLAVALSTSWQPIKLDQENANGTSQITTYNSDGSSTSTYYSGPNGTGAATEIDQENADGTSQITTYNSDGSSTSTYYGGSNGTGTITKTDQENSNGTSKITTYNPDGSSTSTYYNGPNGTGSVTEVDQENADGSSQITTYGPDGSSTTTYYPGPNGTGTPTQYDTITISSITYNFTGNTFDEFQNETPGYSPVTSDPGSSPFAGKNITAMLTIDYNAFYEIIGNGDKIYEFSGCGILSFSATDEVTTLSLGNQNVGGVFVVDANYNVIDWSLGGGAGPNSPISGFNFSSVNGDGDDAEIMDAEGNTYIAYVTVPGVWSPPNISVTETSSAAAGQDQPLSDTLTNSAQAGQIEIESLTIEGPGTFFAVGVETIPYLEISGGSNLSLQGGTVNTDPITIDADGNISGNGTITGGETNNGTITAIGGTLDLSGDISGSGALIIDSGAALLLEGTVASNQNLIFNGTGETLILGTASSIFSAIIGFGPGDSFEMMARR